MKISISTLPFKTWSADDVIKCCVDAGYDALEIRTDFHEWSDRHLPNSHFEELSKKIKAAGLDVVDLGSSVGIPHYKQDGIEDMKRLFEVAEILGAKGIRIMLGHGRNFASMPILPIDVDGIYKWLLEVDELAGKAGKQTWIETHNNYASGASLAKLFNDIELKHTKVVWDIMHPLEEDETIEQTMDYIYKHTAHIHIKDGHTWNDPEKLIWKYTKVGEGDCLIPEIVETVQKAGYDGYFSLEWESSWRQEIRDLDCDAEQIAAFPAYMRALDIHAK